VTGRATPRLVLSLVLAFASAQELPAAAPGARHVVDFTGQVSGQKFGTSVIADNGDSIDIDADSPLLSALIRACPPESRCRLSGWARSDGTLTKLESAARVDGVPAPPQRRFAPSFDCAKATARVEALICGSERLSQLDRELAVAYRAARARAPEATLAQASWLRHRDACKDETCVQAAYEERLRALAH